MTELAKVDLLVFGAHADDIELACGGTILKAVRSGSRVGIVDLTRGEMGTRGDVETRLKESLASAKVLGASFRERVDFGDGGMRTGPDEEDRLIEIIRACRPRIIIGPWPDERHPDHVRAGRLITDAWFYAGLEKRMPDLSSHRADAVVYYQQNYIQHPSFVVDVTDVWEDRMKAVRCYESQFWKPDSAEPETFISQKSFFEMIEARARHFGALIGRDKGEGFLTRQPPMIDDIAAAYAGREIH